MNDVAVILCKQMVTMSLYMLLGFILIRKKIFNAESTRHLTNLTIYIIAPLLSLSCFNFDYSTENLKLFGLTLFLSLIVEGIGIILSNFVRIGADPAVLPCERFGIIFGNTGFIGTPITLHLLGTVGGFYNVSFNVTFNMLNWTYGLVMLGRVKGKRSLKTYLKLFNHPLFYCIGIGFVMYLARLHFPDLIQSAVTNLGNMTSPLAMICCGMYLSQGKPLAGFKNPRVYVLCFFRLVAVPAVTILLLKFLALDHILALSIAVAAATPMASITIFFSNDSQERLQRSMEFFIVSMILSIVTMPLICGYASTIL